MNWNNLHLVQNNVTWNYMKIINLKKIKYPLILASNSWFICLFIYLFCSSFLVHWRARGHNVCLRLCSLFGMQSLSTIDLGMKIPSGVNCIQNTAHQTLLKFNLKMTDPSGSKSLCSFHSCFPFSMPLHKVKINFTFLKFKFHLGIRVTNSSVTPNLLFENLSNYFLVE